MIAAITDGTMADVELPGEVSLELSPDQLLIRSNSFFHGAFRSNLPLATTALRLILGDDDCAIYSYLLTGCLCF